MKQKIWEEFGEFVMAFASNYNTRRKNYQTDHIYPFELTQVFLIFVLFKRNARALAHTRTLIYT